MSEKPHLHLLNLLYALLCNLLKNVTANHRVNDIIATEDGPQTLVGRFMYGPLDMVTLTGEKVNFFSMVNFYRHMFVYQ